MGLTDQNGDGFLEQADFETWIGRMAAIRGWEKGTEGYAQLEGLFLEAFKGMAAAFGGDDGRMETAVAKQAVFSMAESGAPELGE